MKLSEICDRELLGNDPRYGCRCKNCVEGKYEEAESKCEEYSNGENNEAK